MPPQEALDRNELRYLLVKRMQFSRERGRCAASVLKRLTLILLSSKVG